MADIVTFLDKADEAPKQETTKETPKQNTEPEEDDEFADIPF